MWFSSAAWCTCFNVSLCRHASQEVALRKAALEAAYDGEEGRLGQLLQQGRDMGIKEPVSVLCCAVLCCAVSLQDAHAVDAQLELADSHGNSLLSEAAAGGATSSLQVSVNVLLNCFEDAIYSGCCIYGECDKG